MARYTGPKHRLARREAVNIFEKHSSSLERRLNVPPGQLGSKRARQKPSDYSHQLRAKQKAKRTYGLLEKQFRRYYEKAAQKKGKTGETLVEFLESRLDNVVYRLGFAKSRNQSRQFTTHNHVLVNGVKVNIPSYQVKINDIISFDKNITENPDVKKLLEDNFYKPPLWLERKAAVGKVLRLPAQEDIETNLDLQLITEFYSR